MKKTPGYLRPEDEVPNSKKFAIKALKKKLSQKDVGARMALIQEKGMMMPGILEAPAMGMPKAKDANSHGVRGRFRGGKPVVGLKAGGLGNFVADMSKNQKLLLAGATLAGLFYFREPISQKLGISL